METPRVLRTCRIEQGLVNDDSPFRATRQFGISLVHQSGVSEIGTMLRIEQHKQLADGQIVIVSRGKPVLHAG